MLSLIVSVSSKKENNAAFGVSELNVQIIQITGFFILIAANLRLPSRKPVTSF